MVLLERLESNMSTDIRFAVSADTSGDVPTELFRSRLLNRRLNGALYDLGLRERLPSNWVTPVCSGWYFSPFTHHQADKLVVALEGLAVVLEGAGQADYLRARAFPGRGQQAFPLGDC